MLSNTDVVWVVLGGALVFLMQAGFLCVEVGVVRPKAARITALKNVVDWVICCIFFFFFGWGIMFGHNGSWGLFGTDGFSLHYDAASLSQGLTSIGIHTHFLFQLAFAGTAATIVSGALAERTSFYAYMFFSAAISALIYPVVGHWIWGYSFFDLNKADLFLVKMGFIDFAGSTVVHSVGGWCALVGVIVTGARIGKFDANGKAARWDMTGLHFTALGVLLLWVAWWGFNGGSTLAVNEKIGPIIINTNIAGACGGLGAILYRRFFKQSEGISEAFLNGILGGLVGITACCFMVTPLASVAIGISSGIISTAGADFLLSRRLDDPVGAIPVHLFCGIWGTLCVAIFGKADVISQHAGDRLTQLGVQALGIIIVGVWCVGISMIVFWALKRWVGLRVSPTEELSGFDIEGAFNDERHVKEPTLSAQELAMLFNEDKSHSGK